MKGGCRVLTAGVWVSADLRAEGRPFLYEPAVACNATTETSPVPITVDGKGLLALVGYSCAHFDVHDFF